ncbi:hypothetical protein PTSG_11311 [Salpingoeca rosetta]|uniref:Solute carrier family 39 n=1 Tax=Salpingoeca rosetta (strain ATCC 50818 / BSB-021) TaxID=946362 RepID=F2UT15_SALR5|nr:uncharacterized protein PTSG_11311 [Salpingoeca rosetta]EGD81274.1 hypothetical protein PTSG_11311 [Salpingoeca rosetta]|eukprot:XP_004987670.1 hypothetical protein PTSG_11311 [Salpingoeca rosetta]
MEEGDADSYGGVPTLVAMCAAMFFGAFGAGQLPLCLNIPPARTRQVNVFAAGLLLGTALIIIVPEGLHMWLEALQHGQDHDHGHETAHGGHHGMGATATTSTSAARHNHHDHHDHGDLEHEHGAHAHLPHWQVGIAMALGFVFMLVVEKISGGFGHSHHGGEQPARTKELLPIIATSLGDDHNHGSPSSAAAADAHRGHGHHHETGGSASNGNGNGAGGKGAGSASDGGRGSGGVSDAAAAAAATGNGSTGSKARMDLEAAVSISGTAVAPPPTAAFLGLLIHSAVDGIALGASCFAGGETTTIIFLAIMLHKAPAALGLCVYLGQQGQKQRDVRRYLLIFSIAAPVGAVLTFAGMAAHIFTYQLLSLALIMLFSGGTFLFVATAHILPELMHEAPPSWPEVAILCAGVVAPFFISIEHGH